MEIKPETKGNGQRLEHQALRTRLSNAFGIAVIGVLLPVVFWKTNLPHSALLFWGVVQIPISLSLIAAIASRQRGNHARARYWSLFTLTSWTLSFAVLPWLAPVSASVAPDKYILFCALLVVTSVLASTATQLPHHRFQRVSLLLGVAMSYGLAYVINNEGTIAAITALWTLFVFTNSEVNVRAALELKRLKKISEHAATHDNLTQLLNRQGFLGHVEKTLTNPSGQNLVIIDLNSFKLVNDAFGHQFGDHVLSEVGQRLTDNLPPESRIARFGGDEFAALIPLRNTEEIHALLKTVLTRLQKPISYRKRTKQIGVSIGIASHRPGISVSDWMAEADIAMYRSKQSLTSSISFFDMKAREENIRRVELEERFRVAIAKREITFWCQPLVRADDQHPIGVELLARWPQSDGSFISPAEFIPIAQQTSLIIELGKQALECAADLLERWAYDPVLSNLEVNVNISPSHLSSDLDGDIRQIYPSMDSKLGIEFVETDLISNCNDAENCLQQLADSGLRLIIDDFGVGYSSMSYLWSLPVSEVKIDRSFIDGIEHDIVRQKLIAAMVTMTDALGMSCVAEGIETPEAISVLQQHRVQKMQGYWIAHPQPAALAEETLRRLYRNSTFTPADTPVIDPGIPNDPTSSRELQPA